MTIVLYAAAATAAAAAAARGTDEEYGSVNRFQDLRQVADF